MNTIPEGILLGMVTPSCGYFNGKLVTLKYPKLYEGQVATPYYCFTQGNPISWRGEIGIFNLDGVVVIIDPNVLTYQESDVNSNVIKP
jgi:hypothetical protein